MEFFLLMLQTNLYSCPNWVLFLKFNFKFNFYCFYFFFNFPPLASQKNRNFQTLLYSEVYCDLEGTYALVKLFFFWFGGILGSTSGAEFPSPWATMLVLRLDCSTAALTPPQKVLPILKLVELNMLDLSDRMRTGISILTSAADLAKLI